MPRSPITGTCATTGRLPVRSTWYIDLKVLEVRGTTGANSSRMYQKSEVAVGTEFFCNPRFTSSYTYFYIPRIDIITSYSGTSTP
jgi:hypothetical protein